jgi:hypothetical protein
MAEFLGKQYSGLSKP